MEKSRIFFDNEIAIVYFNCALDALVLEYKAKNKSFSDFIEANTATLEAFTLLNTTNFITDFRYSKAAPLRAQQWILENLFPKAAEHLKGKVLLHLQLIGSDNLLSKATLIQFKEIARKHNFVFEQFTSEIKLTSFLNKRLKKAS